ncbi:MAG: DUF2256 domain-containing protein [Actinobacteria bacterium]|nr:DUF2256 domain-containing protein [Actinomycetota bacterium]
MLPPLRTCAECGQDFYRSEGGRSDALYCSERCRSKATTRRWRERHG